MTPRRTAEAIWRDVLAGRVSGRRLERILLRLLPMDPRCKVCNAPYRGAGGAVMRALGRPPSPKNPNFCNTCERFARKYPGGAEGELSFLFADVRGSTAVAERMTPMEFTRLMNRFYDVTTRVLMKSDAWIDKLVGDEVIGLYLPFLGERRARIAVETAQELLRVTGHADPGGPWLPVGAGVHTGRAYFGVVGSEQTVSDITALGDAVNVPVWRRWPAPGRFWSATQPIEPRAWILVSMNDATWT